MCGKYAAALRSEDDLGLGDEPLTRIGRRRDLRCQGRVDSAPSSASFHPALLDNLRCVALLAPLALAASRAQAFI
ncbi:hypothetical protein PC116_g12909 [Phytophthora cactorum]|nr:hypothetical protein PC116_g12909 [Phytophthora cactorum]